MSFDPPPQTSRGGMTFIRFVVGTNQERARQQTGVVAELRLLKESGDLPDYEHEHVAELFAWLNDHLPCPPFSSAEWPEDAVSWFKPSAVEFIARFREIITILEEHGRFVRTLTTTDPGVIRYEDEFQVVTSSWKY
ncbi:hypothetical protein [Prosthecobacter sp.]|uniref:hypothetical protein n=1 Tax=Prosthecobacter sp. TaxID=1965333 RepID=UPI001DE05BC2|nr:hypothetical protein [Prosthecobacter sp.]MCB1275680.1 hypothetical protein [Prosthecobacter sp.]